MATNTPSGPSIPNEVEIRSNLTALENLMEEFFSLSTSNERKREIEGILSHFGQQKDAWRQCLQFMTRTGSQYVCMYSLNTLESIIKKQWLAIPGSEHAEIRTSLNRFLIEHYKTAPSFIKNKLIKLIVDIARTDWPHFYPDFFVTIVEMISNPGTMLLGLNMLLITSEELATPREDLCTLRKEELRKLLTNETKTVLKALTSILNSVLEKQQRLASHNTGGTSTPPSSPCPLQHDETDRSATGGHFFTTSPLPDKSALLHTASFKLSKSNGLEFLKPLDTENDEVAALALQCLGHLFTWIPLSSNISIKLLNIVFQYASLGSVAEDIKESRDEFCLKERNSNLGILAMTTINEIMYKNCVPQDFETYLLHLFKNTFNLLQTIVQSGQANLDNTYMDKLSEFLHSFVSSHLRRFESNPNFPVLEFLALLFKYTFLQIPSDRYYLTLDSWRIIVDLIASDLKQKKSPDSSPPTVVRYHEAFVALVNEILKRIQLETVDETFASSLGDLDDTSLDDDDETEWQQYIRNSIETVMKVSEILPEEVLRIMYDSWKNSMQSFLALDKHVVDGTILIPEDPEHSKLRNALKDFATLVQFVGRIFPLFIGDHFLVRIQEGHELFKQLIFVASYCSKMKFHTLRLAAETVKELVDVHAQTLASLKSWCHWIQFLHSLSLKNTSYQEQCRELTTGLMVAVAPVIRDNNPDNLVHSASHFMVTLTGTVRPPSIWKVKEFTDLYSSVHRLKIPFEDYRLMIRALTNVLLLHWPGLSEQRWDERQKHLSKFLRDITGDLRGTRVTDNFEFDKQKQIAARSIVIKTYSMISDLVENTLNEITQTKKLCYDCVKEYIEIALWLFPIYLNDARVCESLFSFFHIAFDVLKTQMGPVSVEQAIQTFLNLFNKDLLTDAIVNEGSTGTRVVEQFLGILEFIVKEPTSSFRKFIPSTISLCMDHIYPLVAEKPSADIKAPLYRLLFNILLHNQRYFFKPSVVRSLGAPSANDGTLNRAEFLSIMQAFGQSFLQPDITVFQQNLKALEELNFKWKLYHKRVFTESLIEHFLTVLLQVLIHRSHDLLKEEIMVCVFNMAQVDFVAFFDQFLAHFLQNTPDLDDNQRGILKEGFRPDTDLPSFSSNVTRFVNDLRYYKICNESLPANSVKL